MAQETPAMREVRIERHRKKQFSQKHIQHEQELLNKLKGKLNCENKTRVKKLVLGVFLG